MKKLLYIGILIATVILGTFLGYRKYNDGCYEVCKSPQKNQNFKKLNIENQYQTYLKCDCNYDSVKARNYWGYEIGENPQAIDFISNKLRSESDEEVLTQTLHMLQGVARIQNIKGRENISSLVKQTVNKISDRDERSFISKILGSESISRKEILLEVSKEIGERTAMTKEEYQEMTERRFKKEIKEKVKDTIEKIKQSQTNSK